jgi:hypothetical protein
MSSFISEKIVGSADETDSDKASRILAALNDAKATHTQAATADASTTPKEEPQHHDGDALALNGADTTQETQNEISTPSPAMLEYREKVVDWQLQVKKAEQVQRRIRIMVIFCCLGVIVSAILMLVMGVDGLMNSVEDAQVGLGQMSGLATAGIALIDQFFAGQNTAINATGAMLQTINNFCPAVQEQLCANISTATDCNYTGVPNEQEIQEIVEYFTGIQDMVYDELAHAKSDLEEIVDVTAQVEQQMENFNWAFYVSAIFAAALALLSIFILIGVVLAWRNQLHNSCFRWVRNLLVVPIFVLLVFLSLLFSCIFVVGSITASDVCYGSPDPFVLELLSKMESEFNPLGYRFMRFYVSGCPVTDVPLDMNDQVTKLLGYLELIYSFLEKLANDPTLLATCGVTEVGLETSLNDVATLTCFLTTMVLDIRDYLNCNNWNPVYAVRVTPLYLPAFSQGFVFAAFFSNDKFFRLSLVRTDVCV